MTTVNKSFTAVGAGPSFTIQPGQSFTHDVSGTFVGTVVLEHTRNGGITFEPVEKTVTGVASGTIEYPNNENSPARYRWRCSLFTSGTIVTQLADVSDPVVSSDVIGGDGNLVYRGVDDGLEMGDGKDILTGTTTGTSLGKTTSQKGGFHGSATSQAAAPTSQTSAMTFAASGTTSATIGAVTSAANSFGLATKGQIEALITTVENNQARIAELAAALAGKGMTA